MVGYRIASKDSIPSIASKLKPSTQALFEVIPRDVQYEMCFGGRERHMNKVGGGWCSGQMLERS